ncbi:hypothetical protein ACFP81_09545 [Deinococcus lacus]|uniref:Uncharacterized protein n=1 Tax=Deinococcus lacus TaxID=392561 RepID=A0ABW1YD06_9DEIO
MTRSALLACGLGFLLLPPAWFAFTSDSARRAWVLSLPGMGGMGGGPAQLWALMACVAFGPTAPTPKPPL